MIPEDFVKNFYVEMMRLKQIYFNTETKTEVSEWIDRLQLDGEKAEYLRQIINGVLRDTFYTTLLGLDGAASIGSVQEMFKIFDEGGSELTGGNIEALAWEYFHNNRYEYLHSKADFIAELNYLTSEQGGRRTPALSGYRPQVKFDFDVMQTSGQQTFIDRTVVYPGDTVMAEIKILGVEHFAGRLSENMRFEFLEGPRLIGTGQIKHIVNKDLKR